MVSFAIFYWTMQHNKITKDSTTLSRRQQTIENMESFEKLMIERKSKIREYCTAKAKLPRQLIESRNLYVLQSKSLVWCPVYKAAATKWCHNLLYLAGKTQQEVEQLKKDPDRAANLQARLVAPALSFENILEVIDSNATSLIIVRSSTYNLVHVNYECLSQTSF